MTRKEKDLKVEMNNCPLKKEKVREMEEVREKGRGRDEGRGS